MFSVFFYFFSLGLNCYKQDDSSVWPKKKQNLYLDYLKPCLNIFVFIPESVINLFSYMIHSRLSHYLVLYTFIFCFILFVFLYSLIIFVTLEVAHSISICLAIIFKFLSCIVHLKNLKLINIYTLLLNVQRSLAHLYSYLSPFLHSHCFTYSKLVIDTLSINEFSQS